MVLPTRQSEGAPPVPASIGVGVHAPLSWQLLANLSRVSSQVVKDILILYVVVPDELTEEDCRTPEVLARLAVREVPVRRWQPERDRL